MPRGRLPPELRKRASTAGGTTIRPRRPTAKPTAAAMRAACRLAGLTFSSKIKSEELEDLARIIDRETALPLLLLRLEALLDAYDLLYSDCTDDQYGQADEADPRVRDARAALEQAKGE